MPSDSNGQAHLLGGDQPGLARLAAAFARAVVANSDDPFDCGGPFGPRMGRRGSGGNRLDIPGECGYPSDAELDINWFKRVYNRWGIPARFVNIWPDECWVKYPRITADEGRGTDPFEKAVNELDRATLLLTSCHRADRLSRIAQFGVMFLGFDDGGRLDRAPVGINQDTGERTKAFKGHKLNYVRTFDQTVVRVAATEKDVRNKRYGRPTYYSVQFASIAAQGSSTSAGPSSGPGTGQVTTGDPTSGANPGYVNRVHWTRMIHLAEACENSVIYGTPPLLHIADYLHDLRKVVGGSSEMFWRGGFPGYAFETYPDLVANGTINQEKLADQMHLYGSGMQRYLATQGGKWTSLQPQVASPDKHLDWYVKLICATDGIPTRIFLGSESGHLASTEDDATWRSRCEARQVRYLEPLVVRPLLDRLITVGALPDPGPNGYKVSWQDLRSLSSKDRADVALKKIQALQTFYAADTDQKFPDRMMLTMVMGFTEGEADAIEAELKKNPPKLPLEYRVAPPAPPVAPGGPAPNGGGIRTGKAPRAPAGRPTGRVEKTRGSANKPSAAGRRGAKGKPVKGSKGGSAK